MTSLYYVTEHVKLLAKWAGILIGSIILLVFLFRFIVFLKEVIAPTPPPPPTMTWGSLPQLVLPESIYNQKFTYTVNTLSGELPLLPDRVNVYLLATPEASLQSLKNVTDLVANAGFEQEGIRISESVYQWLNPKPPSKKIQYDIVSKDFKLTSEFLSDPNVLTAANLPSEEESQSAAEDFLAGLDAFPKDLDATKSAVSFFAIENGILTPTTSFSNAHIVRVDFFQKDIDQLPIYYPEYPKSPIFVLVGAGDFDGDIVEAEYYHHTITEVSSTYPLYTANEAFELLKKGKGYIVSHKGSGTNVLIQNAKLGYYLAKDSKTYLMPIIIFEGNNDFVAYISAVKGQ